MLFLSLAPSVVLAQNPWRRPTDAIEIRYADSQPVISYTLRLSATDTTGFEMEMRVRNAPDTFELAMAASTPGLHPARRRVPTARAGESSPRGETRPSAGA